jgi:mannose-6-phosphate isomerase-like protein (cupin superfamily)
MSSENSVEGREEKHSHYTVSSRKWIAQGQDVYVKEFLLAIGEQVPWHHHTNVFDVFYCLEGRMTIERIDVFSGEVQPTIALSAGESARVDVGTAHRPFNPGPGQLRFLIVQGVGDYDYLPFTPA